MKFTPPSKSEVELVGGPLDGMRVNVPRNRDRVTFKEGDTKRKSTYSRRIELNKMFHDTVPTFGT